jgi:hypothetical protein
VQMAKRAKKLRTIFYCLAWMLLFGLFATGFAGMPRHHRVNGKIVSSTLDPATVPLMLAGMSLGLGLGYVIHIRPHLRKHLQQSQKTSGHLS